MKNQVTSIERSRRLIELGVPAEKASMCWVKDPNEDEYNLSIHDEYCYEVAALEPRPAFTVADLLEKVLPNAIQTDYNSFELTLNAMVGGGWQLYYNPIIDDGQTGAIMSDMDDDLITLLCGRVECLLSNGYKLND